MIGLLTSIPYINSTTPVGYPYTDQLTRLDIRHPRPGPVTHLPAALLEITTPLISSVWESELAAHPDQTFATYVTQGIKHGFRVGFNHTKELTVNDYLQQQLAPNRMLVIPEADLPHIHCHISPFGVIPKHSKPGKWRLIVDLSFPTNLSINDGIDKQGCSISYITIDEVVDSILRMGRGTLMAKADIKQAYRIVPVHPEDRHLLAVQWDNRVIVDKVLPFGLRSAPLIFTAIADALQWIMCKRGVQHIAHYLDDFIIVGPPGSSQCANSLAKLIKTCEYTGTPLEVEKCEGPTPVITFPHGSTTSARQTDKAQTTAHRLVLPQSRQKEGPTVPHWIPAACLKSSAAGPLIPTSAN